MKRQTFTLEDILTGCDREHDELINEILDRINYVALQTDGYYSFCAESPAEMDILKMVTRLCIKRREERAQDECITCGGMGESHIAGCPEGEK